MADMQKKKRKSSLFLTLKGLFVRSGGDVQSILEEEQLQSPFRTIVKNFVENKIAMAGVIVFLLIFLCTMILPLFFPLDLAFQDATQQNIAPGLNMQSVPKALQGKAVEVSSGASFGVGVDSDGNVYQWGKLDDRLKKLPKFQGKVVSVSAGMSHALALDENGKVYTWGYNRQGVGTIPPEVQFEKIVQIAAGDQVSYALSEGGELFIWGNQTLISADPGKYQGRIRQVAPSVTTAMALLDDGAVVQLSSKATPYANIPADLPKAAAVAVTDKSAAVLSEDGRVIVWGSSDAGNLSVPERIQGHVTQLVSGTGHYTVLLDDGSVASWGRNNFNQSDAPALTGVTEVSAGFYGSYAISSDGTVKPWGLKGYVMGTDQYGRDVFSRLLTGGRMTMTIGAIAVIISTIVGIIIGGISGYYGGVVDNLLMRFTEIVMSIPFLPFAMILPVLVGNNISEVGRISMIMVILGLLSWPSLARLVRAQILSEREKEFVTAAKAMGIREMNIVFRHILPNVITVIIVNTTLAFATCMLTESTLSFLGFGVSEPNPTWGNMLSNSQSSQVIGEFWWRWVFPSIALGLSTISINSIGDGLRDAIDPRSNER